MNNFSSSLIERLEKIVRHEVKTGFSGAIYVQQQTTILDLVVGSISGTLLKPDACFWVASVGKQFASAALFVCQDRDLLEVDASIAKFLPNTPRDKERITIRQLLTHSSGLPQNYISEGASDRHTAIANILSQPLISSPGERFVYSNDNYQLVAAIVEIVTGQPYRDFVKSELLLPHGLGNTDIAQTVADIERVSKTLSTLPERFNLSNWGQQGWYSTASDLTRWSWLLRSGNILSAKSTAQIFEPVVAIQEGAAASGWFIRTDQGSRSCIFTRGNEDFGANSLVYLYPAIDLSIVILTHAGDKDEDTSYSRFIHTAFEDVLFAQENNK